MARWGPVARKTFVVAVVGISGLGLTRSGNAQEAYRIGIVEITQVLRGLPEYRDAESRFQQDLEQWRADLEEMRAGYEEWIRAMGLPEEQLQQQLAAMEETTPARQSAAGFVGTFFTSLVAGAIVGIFVRKR